MESVDNWCVDNHRRLYGKSKDNEERDTDFRKTTYLENRTRQTRIFSILAALQCCQSASWRISAQSARQEVAVMMKKHGFGLKLQY
jgi:hypothetical protein